MDHERGPVPRSPWLLERASRCFVCLAWRTNVIIRGMSFARLMPMDVGPQRRRSYDRSLSAEERQREQRERILGALIRVVAQQLAKPPVDKEVTHERS